MAEINLDGVGVALITPFKKDLSIDFDALDNLIEHVITGGCDYIVALGTTAESPVLSQDEKYEITDFIRHHTAGRVPLVIGIGGNNTAEVIRVIQHTDLKGYSAILSVAPYYNKPTQEGLFQHFKAIGESSPLPILLYNVPGRTGVNITACTTIRLAELSPKFCGIKEASSNIEQCKEIIAGTPDNFKLISGDDASTCDIMESGGKGVISVLANAYPGHVKNLINICRNRDSETSHSYQKSLNNLIRHLFEDGNPSGIKAVLHSMGMIENVLRLPLVPVSHELEQKLIKAMHEMGS